MPKKSKLQLVFSDNYLALIKNSVGSALFKNCYAEIENKRLDLTKNGKFSCAYFVSFVLKYFDLIKKGHLTVDGLIRDMSSSNWIKRKYHNLKSVKEGSVLLWEEVDSNKHVGFYIGKGRAISTNPKTGKVAIHSFNYGGKRNVEYVLWNRTRF